MCVMEVHVGQHTSTMCQAMVHNLETVRDDLAMLAPVMEARKDDERWLEALQDAAMDLTQAHERLYLLYVRAVQDDTASGCFNTDHERQHGAERIHKPVDLKLLEEAMTEATLQAERYETR